MGRTVKQAYVDVAAASPGSGDKTFQQPVGVEVLAFCDTCEKHIEAAADTPEEADDQIRSFGWYIGPQDVFCEVHRPGATGMRKY